MRTYHSYTTGDDATIRKMWGVFPTEAIANELGVTVKSLNNHIMNMEPPLPKDNPRSGFEWKEFEDNALLLMNSFGIPVSIIAEALQRGTRSCERRIQFLKGRN